jgi:hypothetical protein
MSRAKRRRSSAGYSTWRCRYGGRKARIVSGVAFTRRSGLMAGHWHGHTARELSKPAGSAGTVPGARRSVTRSTISVSILSPQTGRLCPWSIWQRSALRPLQPSLRPARLYERPLHVRRSGRLAPACRGAAHDARAIICLSARRLS